MTSFGWDHVISWRLSRGHLEKKRSRTKLVETARDLCGVHAQILSTVAPALGARISKLTLADVTSAIADERSLVKTWAMRGTLHVFAADDLPLYCAAQETRDQYTNDAFLRYFDLERADIEAVQDAIPQALDGVALSREALSDQILAITKRKHLEERLRSGWGELLKPAAFRGLLCFGPQEGRAVTFVRPDQWLGKWTEYETDEAMREVFRRFLSVYGPADRKEIARWWGFRPPQAGRVLKQMTDELVEVEIESGQRWLLKKDLRSLEGAGPVEGVRMLPSFDQLLVMCAPHRTALVDEAFGPRIYRDRIAVWSLPAVLIDGRVRAAWKLERRGRKGTVIVEPFEKLSKRSIFEIEEETLGTLGPSLGLDLTISWGPDA